LKIDHIIIIDDDETGGSDVCDWAKPGFSATASPERERKKERDKRVLFAQYAPSAILKPKNRMRVLAN
jgi:hypothetical protein